MPAGRGRSKVAAAATLGQAFPVIILIPVRFGTMLRKEHFLAASTFTGVAGTVLVYAVLQERMMTVPFGTSGELFQYTVFLVFFNRLATFLVACLLLKMRGASLAPYAPLFAYGAVSAGNVFASTCQYEALKYVSFPLQTLSKCMKTVPVILWGSVIGGKRYSRTEWLEALVIVLGCSLFILTGDVLSNVVGGDDVNAHLILLTGLVLLAGYLLFDGFTSSWQDHMFRTYGMDETNLMLYTTVFSMALSLSTLVYTGTLLPAMAFMARNPEAWVWIGMTSSVAAAVQLLFTFTIRKYGALTFATLMTMRQFVSILVSCVVFGHTLQLSQWFGAMVVFACLFHKIFLKRRRKQTSSNPGKDGGLHAQAALPAALPSGGDVGRPLTNGQSGHGQHGVASADGAAAAAAEAVAGGGGGAGGGGAHEGELQKRHHPAVMTLAMGMMTQDVQSRTGIHALESHV